jgi:hypothetical protein
MAGERDGRERIIGAARVRRTQGRAGAFINALVSFIVNAFVVWQISRAFIKPSRSPSRWR